MPTPLAISGPEDDPSRAATNLYHARVPCIPVVGCGQTIETAVTQLRSELHKFIIENGIACTSRMVRDNRSVTHHATWDLSELRWKER